MTLLVPQKSDHLLYWITAALLLVSFGLADAAVVAWAASVVTIGQLLAVAFTFVLTGSGVVFTAWRMRR